MPSSTSHVRRHPIPEPPPFDPSTDADTVAIARGVADDATPEEKANGKAALDRINDLAEAEFIETDREVVAIVPVTDVPATHHLVVGMGTLAAMSEEEFKAKLAVMKAGQERIRIIQEQLLTKGEDYGTVKGIKRPFLHQPGAEKLANFYGFALRQELKRVVGDGITAPPLSYETTTFVHLGDFEGPIVAQGFGEANSWEDKYRYVFAKPLCPKCGHEMKKGGDTGKMAGSWFCPGYEGGCWNKIGITETNADGTLRIEPPGKVDNPDPYSLAETLVQMSVKRSMVAGVRRATGTSGLFTQDEDSPGVQAQSDDAGGSTPNIGPAEPIGIPIEVGAKTSVSTQVQHDRLKVLVKEKGLGGAKIAALLERLFSMEVEPTGAAASAAVKTLDGEQMGRLLLAIETGTVPNAIEPESDAVAEASAPTKATN